MLALVLAWKAPKRHRLRWHLLVIPALLLAGFIGISAVGYARTTLEYGQTVGRGPDFYMWGVVLLVLGGLASFCRFLAAHVRWVSDQAPAAQPSDA